MPGLSDDQAALDMAFEQYVSGRSPERRGNGLKYVRRSIEAESARGVACWSGSGGVAFGGQGQRCGAVMKKHLKRVNGTATIMLWELM